MLKATAYQGEDRVGTGGEYGSTVDRFHHGLRTDGRMVMRQRYDGHSFLRRWYTQGLETWVMSTLQLKGRRRRSVVEIARESGVKYALTTTHLLWRSLAIRSRENATFISNDTARNNPSEASEAKRGTGHTNVRHGEDKMIPSEQFM